MGTSDQPAARAEAADASAGTEADCGATNTMAVLLGQLRHGDDSARVAILDTCHARMRALSHRLLGKFAKVRRWDDTDDVAQNAALRLYRALADTVPDSPRALLGLMATQIQRELLDLARKHSGPMSYAANHGTNVRPGLSTETRFVDAVPDDDSSNDEIPIERWEAFHQAVDALPEELRDVFKGAWYLGLGRLELAETLGLSPRTLDRRWQEARKLISQAVQETDE